MEIPRGRNIQINVNSQFKIHRHNLTCYRCGKAHHFRSECSTFRTRLCSLWQSGVCTEPYCSFAHGEHMLRQPWIPTCVRVMRTEGGKIVRLGCGKVGHHYSACPRLIQKWNVAGDVDGDGTKVATVCSPCGS